MAAAGGGHLTGNGVREIAPGIWCWQRRPRGLRPGAFRARTSYAQPVLDEGAAALRRALTRDPWQPRSPG
jgi:hypothetical protein